MTHREYESRGGSTFTAFLFGGLIQAAVRSLREAAQAARPAAGRGGAASAP